MHLFRFRSIFTLFPAELHFNWNWKRSWDVCCSQFTMNVKLFAEIWWSLWLCVPVPMYIAMATVYISNGTTNHYHIQFEFAIAMLLDWIQYFIWIWIWLNGRIGKKKLHVSQVYLASKRTFAPLRSFQWTVTNKYAENCKIGVIEHQLAPHSTDNIPIKQRSFVFM